MKKKKILGCIIIILSVCLYGCGADNEKTSDGSRSNTVSNVQQESANANIFEMNHEIRTGFITPKEEEIDTADFIVIESVSDLKAIENDSKKSYILTADLDMSGVSWNTINFSGYLEGNHHIISGMKKRLFGDFKGKVKNLGLENVEVSDSALVGTMLGGIISNCYVTGTVQGRAGLVKEVHSGYRSSLSSAEIEYCYNAATINGMEGKYAHESDGMGGIVGNVDVCTGPFNISITNCENYGVVNGAERTGGIIGNINRGSRSSGYYDNSKVACYINNCFNYNDVTADEIAGGIIGDIYALNAKNDYENIYFVRQCANYGKISIRDSKSKSGYYSGGICGEVSLKAVEKLSKAVQFEVSDCLNTGDVLKKSLSGGGICGHVEMEYGSCNLRYCINISETGGIFDHRSGNTSDLIIKEECYTKGDMSIAEMKDMSRNLQKFSYPEVWGITDLYYGFPHPYGVDEREAVYQYCKNKHQEEVKELSGNMKEEEIILSEHYVDMLESMNCTGYWPEDENSENYCEYLTSYSESPQVFFAIVDVNDDGEKELAVKALSNYKIYSYDNNTEKAEKIYSSDTEEEWKSDYGNKIEIDWKVMKPENYKIYEDMYESLYKQKIIQNLKNDIATVFIENDQYDFHKIMEDISSNYKIEFQENNDEYMIKGNFDGENVIDIYEEDGSSLCYKKAIEGISLLGIKPGITENEAKSMISQYGFYMGKYNYKMGKYLIRFTVENDIVTEIWMSLGSEYAG